MARQIVLALAIIFCTLASAHGGVAVKADLRTKWLGFPIQAEISEFLASHSSGAFWSFMDKAVDLSSQTEKQIVENGLAIATELLPGSNTRGLLTTALTLNYFNARLEMYDQIARGAIDSSSRKICPGSVVLLNGKPYCTAADVATACANAGQDPSTSVELFAFDHIYPGASTRAPVAVLYADVGDELTAQLHASLKQAAALGQVRYVFRHYYTNRSEAIPLRGYGVELALKSVEYKVMDTSLFADTQLDVEHDSAASVEELAELRDLVDYSLEPLSESDLKGFGLKASSIIESAADPLVALRDISQNLPILARGISTTVPSEETKRRHLLNNQFVDEGSNIVLLNGQRVDVEAIDPFSLFDIAQDMVAKYERLQGANISRDSIIDILSLPPAQRVMPRIRVDYGAISWLNNLEKDDYARRWPKSVKDILRQVFPGQLHFIAKHLFNAVIVADLSDDSALEWTINLAGLSQRGVPLRMGVIVMTPNAAPIEAGADVANQPLGVILAKVWAFLERAHSVHVAGEFITRIAQPRRLESVDEIHDLFVSLYSESEWQTAIGDAYIEEINQAQSFLRQIGIRTPTAFLNGFVLDVPSASQLPNVMASEIFRQRRQMQEWVHKGELTDATTDIYEWILRQDAFPSYNPAVFPSSSRPEKYTSSLISAKLAPHGPFFSAPDSDSTTKTITHIVPLARHRQHQINLALDGISRVMSSPDTRLYLWSCDAPSELNPAKVVRSLVRSSVESSSTYLSLRLAEIAQALLREFTTNQDLSLSSLLETLKMEDETNIVDAAAFAALMKSSEFDPMLLQEAALCASALQEYDESQFQLVTAGRIISGVPSEFTSADFEALEHHERQARINLLGVRLQELQLTSGSAWPTLTPLEQSNLIEVAAASAVKPPSDDARQITIPPEAEYGIRVSKEKAALRVTAVIDPLSRAAQKLSSLLVLLRSTMEVEIKVILVPQVNPTDLTLKNFFRFVVPEMRFTTDGKIDRSHVAAVFAHLPQKRVLSTNIIPPSSWLVEPVVSKYDMDNLMLANIPDATVEILFELEHILLEGSCSDLTSGGIPPRGLQLNLGDAVDPHIQDTLVMSNLGYFQLKANPGVWKLQLGDGRASEIYRIVQTQDGTKSMLLTSFNPKSHILKVEKQPGKKDIPLFEEDTASNGMWDSFTNLWGKPTKAAGSDETINVFSLASGHLYERFLKIMMLSVVKNTNSPVKFWLLKNFLSPSFKESIHALSLAHNFSYELVQYKWPAWLNKQTEKQRIIWGYKILFLDVMFPLGLKKVVYVDADQVVRTDLKELFDMDMEGAPYAFPPFCSGDIMREETKGFRFWDKGFWKDHLRGKPYHISALFLVDLTRFRITAAGDRLRATYDQLSQDPNSLANLDQDLPNYMQHFVPIHSLPREWLWCETWCSDKSKDAAKTIDLCNNPMTKEPKLDNAQRTIPEWVQLDQTARNVAITTPPTEFKTQNEQKDEL